MSVRLRPARQADVEPVVAVFLACWRTAYRGLLPQPTLDAMTDDDARTLWRTALADPASAAIVAEDDAGVVGVVRWTEQDATVQSLYVDPRDQGHGTGGRLLAAAVEALAQAGLPEAGLWVFEANTPARAFYAHRGWLPDGRTRVEVLFGAAELRLVHARGTA